MLKGIGKRDRKTKGIGKSQKMQMTKLKSALLAAIWYHSAGCGPSRRLECTPADHYARLPRKMLLMQSQPKATELQHTAHQMVYLLGGTPPPGQPPLTSTSIPQPPTSPSSLTLSCLLSESILSSISRGQAPLGPCSQNTYSTAPPHPRRVWSIVQCS